LNCPHCHRPLPLQVTGATVMDVVEEWMTDGEIETEKTLFIYVQEREVSYANKHVDRSNRTQAAKVSTRNRSVPALQKDVPAHRRTKVPVLQKTSRQSTGKVTR
jgi:hypothetical protein